MTMVASQITSLTVVYSIVYSGADKKTSKVRVTGLCAGNSPGTGEFPAQRASNAENGPIWWRHHAMWNRHRRAISTVMPLTPQSKYGPQITFMVYISIRWQTPTCIPIRHDSHRPCIEKCKGSQWYFRNTLFPYCIVVFVWSLHAQDPFYWRIFAGNSNLMNIFAATIRTPANT